MAGFTPNSIHQTTFLQNIKDGVPITIFCGGRQTGKTLTGCAAIGLVTIVLGHNIMGKGWVLTPTIDQTKQAKISFERVMGWKINGGLIKRFLAHENAYILDYGTREYRVEFKTASEPDNLRGGVVDWIHLDEAAFLKSDVWEIIQPCVLASGGPIWMTSTPNGFNWFYDLYAKARDGEPSIKAVHAPTSSNPALPPKILIRMMEGYSDERRRAEFEAEFTSSSGLVYPMFKQEFIKEPPKGWVSQIVAGIDPGANDPFAYLWVARNGEECWVVDEYFSSERRTLQTHADRIKSRWCEGNTVRRWSDPARAQDNLDLMVTYGLENWKAKNELKAGIDAVAIKLEKGQLFISPRCENTIREIRNYCYKEQGEIPIDKDNHCMDALRYVIFSERNFTGTNEVIVPINDGAQMASFGDKGFNEVYMPDGSMISGWNEGPPPSNPNSRR